MFVKQSRMSTLTFICVMLVACTASCRATRVRNSLSRLQRQAVTNELASGLTGTGTSFNSLYNDPYLQQNVLNQPYDELAGGYGTRPSKRYPGAYGNRYESVYDPLSGQTGASLGGGVGGVGGVSGSWNGFGLGRGYARGRYPAATGGVKY